MQNSCQNPYPSLIPSKKPGFTLVEVLVVIAIMSVLMTAGSIGLGNINAGKGTTSAVATCESLFEEARTIAISKRCKARILIGRNLSIDGPSKNLRKIFIITEALNPTTGVPLTPTSWVVSGRPYILPTGVFFSEKFSTPQSTGPDRIMGLPGVSSSFQGSHIFYEFNSEGIITTPGAAFIVGSGVRKSDQTIRIVPSAGRDFGGFVTWRNGRTSIYRSPEQMNIPSTATTF